VQEQYQIAFLCGVGIGADGMCPQLKLVTTNCVWYYINVKLDYQESSGSGVVVLE
jgi:hypothetical protein